MPEEVRGESEGREREPSSAKAIAIDSGSDCANRNRAPGGLDATSPTGSQPHQTEDRAISMGRPTLCTPEQMERLCALLREGNTRECAAKLSGIQPRTFYQWMQKGRAGQEPYAQFAHGVKDAEGQAEAWHIANLKVHAANTWQVSCWWLERRRPEKYGKRDISLEITKRAEREAQRAQIAEIPLEELEAMVVAEKARRAREAAAKASDVGALQ